MGVAKFFTWLTERYPHTDEFPSKKVTGGQNNFSPSFDNLYVDVNGILHNVVRQDIDQTKAMRHDEVILAIMKKISSLVETVKPKNLLYLAVDGVAPRAKLNQQRTRRFRKAASEGTGNSEVLSSDFFDTNAITPGTEFMDTVSRNLKYHLRLKQLSDPEWREFKIIFSGQEVPGEGEHKIMDYIRGEKLKPDFNPNLRHCIVGDDADLVMLSLSLHEHHTTIIRQPPVFPNMKLTDIDIQNRPYFYLHIGLLREALVEDLYPPQVVLDKYPNFKVDPERLLDDFILLTFLCGNDFMPHIPSVSIKKNSLDVMLSLYPIILPTLGTYLSSNGHIDFAAFRRFLGILSEIEPAVLEANAKSAAKIIQNRKRTEKITRQQLEAAAPAFRDDIDSLDTDSDSEKSSNNHLGYSVSVVSQRISNDTQLDTFTVEQQLNSVQDDRRFNYYLNKFGIAVEMGFEKDDAFLQSVASSYLEAIQWSLLYYTRGCPSWTWFYPYHYAPLITDLMEAMTGGQIKFQLGAPLDCFKQLLSCLPAESAPLLPEPYRFLMTSPNSPLIQYFPDAKTIPIDREGAIYEHEGVFICPFLPEKEMHAAVAEYCPDSRLSPNELERKQRGYDFLYVYDPSSTETLKSPNSYFQDITPACTRETAFRTARMNSFLREDSATIIEVIDVAKPPPQLTAEQLRLMSIPAGTVVPAPSFPTYHTQPLFRSNKAVGTTKFIFPTKRYSFVISPDPHVNAFQRASKFAPQGSSGDAAEKDNSDVESNVKSPSKKKNKTLDTVLRILTSPDMDFSPLQDLIGETFMEAQDLLGYFRFLDGSVFRPLESVVYAPGTTAYDPVRFQAAVAAQKAWIERHKDVASRSGNHAASFLPTFEENTKYVNSLTFAKSPAPKPFSVDLKTPDGAFNAAELYSRALTALHAPEAALKATMEALLNAPDLEVGFPFYHPARPLTLLTDDLAARALYNEDGSASVSVRALSIGEKTDVRIMAHRLSKQLLTGVCDLTLSGVELDTSGPAGRGLLLEYLPCTGVSVDGSTGAVRRNYVSSKEVARIPQFCFAVQTAVNRPAPDPRFALANLTSAEALFPVGSDVVITEGAFAGSTATVTGYSDLNSSTLNVLGVKESDLPKKQFGLNLEVKKLVSTSVIRKLAPGLATAAKRSVDMIYQKDFAKKVGLSEAELLMLMSPMQLTSFDFNESISVGFNLIITPLSYAPQYVSVRYVTQESRWGNGQSVESLRFSFDPSLVEPVQEYLSKFPLAKTLASNFYKLRRDYSKKMYEEQLLEMRHWARQLIPPTAHELLSMATLPQVAIEALESSFDQFNGALGTADEFELALKNNANVRVLRGVPSSILFARPSAIADSVISSTSAKSMGTGAARSSKAAKQLKLGDVVVNLSSNTAPMGQLGVVVALDNRQKVAQVLYQRKFGGGSSLFKRVSLGRGAVHPISSLLLVHSVNANVHEGSGSLLGLQPLSVEAHGELAVSRATVIGVADSRPQDNSNVLFLDDSSFAGKGSKAVSKGAKGSVAAIKGLNSIPGFNSGFWANEIAKALQPHMNSQSPLIIAALSDPKTRKGVPRGYVSLNEVKDQFPELQQYDNERLKVSITQAPSILIWEGQAVTVRPLLAAARNATSGVNQLAGVPTLAEAASVGSASTSTPTPTSTPSVTPLPAMDEKARAQTERLAKWSSTKANKNAPIAASAPSGAIPISLKGLPNINELSKQMQNVSIGSSQVPPNQNKQNKQKDERKNPNAVSSVDSTQLLNTPLSNSTSNKNNKKERINDASRTHTLDGKESDVLTDVQYDRLARIPMLPSTNTTNTPDSTAVPPTTTTTATSAVETVASKRKEKTSSSEIDIEASNKPAAVPVQSAGSNPSEIVDPSLKTTPKSKKKTVAVPSFVDAMSLAMDAEIPSHSIPPSDFSSNTSSEDAIDVEEAETQQRGNQRVHVRSLDETLILDPSAALRKIDTRDVSAAARRQGHRVHRADLAEINSTIVTMFHTGVRSSGTSSTPSTSTSPDTETVTTTDEAPLRLPLRRSLREAWIPPKVVDSEQMDSKQAMIEAVYRQRRNFIEDALGDLEEAERERLLDVQRAALLLNERKQKEAPIRMQLDEKYISEFEKLILNDLLVEELEFEGAYRRKTQTELRDAKRKGKAQGGIIHEWTSPYSQKKLKINVDKVLQNLPEQLKSELQAYARKEALIINERLSEVRQKIRSSLEKGNLVDKLLVASPVENDTKIDRQSSNKETMIKVNARRASVPQVSLSSNYRLSNKATDDLKVEIIRRPSRSKSKSKNPDLVNSIGGTSSSRYFSTVATVPSCFSPFLFSPYSSSSLLILGSPSATFSTRSTLTVPNPSPIGSIDGVGNGSAKNIVEMVHFGEFSAPLPVSQLSMNLEHVASRLNLTEPTGSYPSPREMMARFHSLQVPATSNSTKNLKSKNNSSDESILNEIETKKGPYVRTVHECHDAIIEVMVYGSCLLYDNDTKFISHLHHLLSSHAYSTRSPKAAVAVISMREAFNASPIPNGEVVNEGVTDVGISVSTSNRNTSVVDNLGFPSLSDQSPVDTRIPQRVVYVTNQACASFSDDCEVLGLADVYGNIIPDISTVKAARSLVLPPYDPALDLKLLKKKSKLKRSTGNDAFAESNAAIVDETQANSELRMKLKSRLLALESSLVTLSEITASTVVSIGEIGASAKMESFTTERSNIEAGCSVIRSAISRTLSQLEDASDDVADIQVSMASIKDDVNKLRKCVQSLYLSSQSLVSPRRGNESAKQFNARMKDAFNSAHAVGLRSGKPKGNSYFSFDPFPHSQWQVGRFGPIALLQRPLHCHWQQRSAIVAANVVCAASKSILKAIK